MALGVPATGAATAGCRGLNKVVTSRQTIGGLLDLLYLHAIARVNCIRRTLDHLISSFQFSEYLNVSSNRLPGLDRNPFRFVALNADDEGVLLIAGYG